MSAGGGELDEPDEVLIQETLSGNMSSFDQLMGRYERLVFKIAYSFGASRENALDITQTVFLKAFGHLSTFRTESSFKTWLLRIAYNEGINWTRSPRNRQDLHDDLDSAAGALSTDGGQESGMLLTERRRMLRRSLQSLNVRYRTALLLRYVHDMPIREIAGVLQCSEPMTKNILFRGVRNLKRALAQAVGPNAARI
jgi:RNA polymerase sigma-70 factor (ECF subfamily)